MTEVEVSRLAQNKGCVLQITLSSDSCLYWIENPYFIGRPYRCLEDLVCFLTQLPLLAEDALVAQNSLL